MNIDSSYNINSLSNVQTNSVEKLSTASSINKTADDASGLVISDQLSIQKSSLSQGLENMNSGIAMSSIAQSAIANQKELLENIKTDLIQAMSDTTSDEGKDAIKEQITKNLDQYDQIASSTNYNGEKLLVTKGDASDDISIVGDDSIIDMSKADTKSLSDTLRGYLSNFDSGAMDNMLNDINTAHSKLDSYASDFGSASNAFKSTANNYMSAEKEMANAKSTIKDVDYAKEVSDFSKNNLLTQIGYLMQTQANPVQSRSVPLIS